MNPPAGSIRAEVHDAVVGGIRQRGPEATGVLIMAGAYLTVAVVTFLVLVLVSWIAGVDLSGWPVAGLSAVSGLVSWLTTRNLRLRLTASVEQQVEAMASGSEADGNETT